MIYYYLFVSERRTYWRNREVVGRSHDPGCGFSGHGLRGSLPGTNRADSQELPEALQPSGRC